MKTVLNIKESPYKLLLVTAVALLLVIVSPPVAHIDFRNKTMFSAPLATIVWITPLLLISIWLLYLLTNRFLYSITITWIHVLITVLATILIVIVLYMGIKPVQPTSDRHELIGNAMQILFLIFVCGQFSYLANVLLGLFKKTNK